jgi:hypothetical protein
MNGCARVIRGATSEECVIFVSGLSEINTIDPTQTFKTTYLTAMIWIDQWLHANTARSVAVACFGLDASGLHLRAGRGSLELAVVHINLKMYCILMINSLDYWVMINII